jgi:hypothetical protein
MNNPKTNGSWNSIWSAIKDFGTNIRGWTNLWVKGWLALQAGIVDKYTGVLPESVWDTASAIADQIPQILNVETDIPGIHDIIMSNPNIAELANDVQNVWNIGAYMAALAIVHAFSKYVMRWEKWRFEDATSSFVWTALSVWIFKEMSDVLNGYWNDIMSWLPLRAFEAMPDSIRDMMVDADSRRNLYAGALWATWAWTTYFAGKNILRLLLWRPKKEKEDINPKTKTT